MQGVSCFLKTDAPANVVECWPQIISDYRNCANDLHLNRIVSFSTIRVDFEMGSLPNSLDN